MNALKAITAACATVLLFGHSAFSQADYFVGIAAGALSDRNHFTAETGHSLTAGALGGMQMFSFGFRKNGIVVASGFGIHRHSWRLIDLNRETLFFERMPQSGPAVNNFVVPISVAKEFKIAGNWHAGFGAGILGLISLDKGFAGKWARYEYARDDNSYILTADSSVTFYGNERGFNMALETSFYLMYQIENGGEFFARVSYQAHLKPNFEARHTFHSEARDIQGSSQGLNSFAISVGVRHYFKFPNKKDPEPQ